MDSPADSGRLLPVQLDGHADPGRHPLAQHQVVGHPRPSVYRNRRATNNTLANGWTTRAAAGLEAAAVEVGAPGSPAVPIERKSDTPAAEAARGVPAGEGTMTVVSAAVLLFLVMDPLGNVPFFL